MNRQAFTRRSFLGTTAGAVTAGAVGVSPWPAAGAARMHISCNQYPWTTFYQRENRDFLALLEEGLAEVRQSGMDGFEPSVNSPKDIDALEPLLRKNGLELRSIYVNSTLHTTEDAKSSISSILAIAERAARIGTKIVVTNPNPIRWGGSENKDDAQLKTQGAALDALGAKLRAAGITLGYHNHDIELRNAAREFHHMLAGTDAKNVSLCLDCHWVYRGSGNSSVALFDVIRLYGHRICELHLRQSVNNIWSETIGEGDIDYAEVAAELLRMNVNPLLVLEQAPEKGTPKTMGALESHRKSREFVEAVFAKLG